MSAIELCVDGEVTGVFPLASSIVTVGRNAECDIALADPKVSGLHAILTRRGTKVHIEDAASTNGLVVNGERRTLSTEVRAGDEVTIVGRYVLRVTDD